MPRVVAPKAPTKALLTYFDQAHVSRFHTRAILFGARDANLMSQLWKARMGEAITVEMLIDEFFATDDPFIQRRGWTVPTFSAQAASLLVMVARRQGNGRERPKNCDCRPPCRDEAAHTAKYLRGLK